MDHLTESHTTPGQDFHESPLGSSTSLATLLVLLYLLVLGNVGIKMNLDS